ncbi:hypothetical protein C7H19_19850 [Aphanothece hegewaldii CCALA 016]|uniref:Uncharacterized protein n=1 Tax=Aphanothece hegewaldii CCALA 016 TaxID=2107694 RepID=A0A2T1LT88_9CHRO|nr:hypothetical protein [Aphanothece hegewaldii]PSF33641.1 hypothetical protein C7H19_19850 [Aphanothece hegewaldii CCALA 016]
MTTKTITQEGFDIKSGYCLDPFRPLLGVQPADGLPNDLYLLAREVDNFGQKSDFQTNLEEIAHEIKTRVLSWYEIGLKAWKVKLYKAWEKKYTSFKEFCERSLGRTPATINNWIRSARVVSQLIAAGHTRLPMSAAVAMELSKIEANGHLEDTWGDLCDRYMDHEITLENVKAHMATPGEPQWKNLRLSREAWDNIRAKAAEAGMSPNKFLEQFFGGHPEPIQKQTKPDNDGEITLHPEDENHPDAAEAIELTDDIVDFCIGKSLVIGSIFQERYQTTYIGALTLSQGYDLMRYLRKLPDD